MIVSEWYWKWPSRGSLDIAGYMDVKLNHYEMSMSHNSDKYRPGFIITNCP